MADDPQQQSVQVAGWGKKFGITGPNAFPWLVIVLLLGGIGYMVIFSLGKWGHPFDISEELTAGRLEVREAHKGFQDALNNNNYILAACLSPVRIEECKRIGERLNMPDSLRKILRQE